MTGKRKIKKAKNRTSGLIKILEAVVVLGSLAALIIKYFRGNKK